jgi:hypothetical protein
MMSFLDRSFDDPSVELTPASVRLESDNAFLPGLHGTVSEIGAIGKGEPWGAFLVTGLPVRLSYPRALDA